MSKIEDAFLFTLMASFWALNYPILKIALNLEPPFVILLFRVMFAALFAPLFLRGETFRGMNLHENIKIFGIGLLNIVIFMGFWFVGESYVSASVSSILIYSYPIFNVMLSILILRERISAGISMGIILGFTGLFLISFHEYYITSALGLIFLIIASVSWALGTVLYKKFLGRTSPRMVNFMQYIYSIPILLILSFVADPAFVYSLSYKFLILMIYMGSLGTAFAYLIYFRLFRKYSVSSISSYFFAVPALSVVFSFFILDEKSSIDIYIGMILISAGIFLSSKYSQ
ncbi:MAG: DMT family transporter [Thermoplasmataceae archaeon]